MDKYSQLLQVILVAIFLSGCELLATPQLVMGAIDATASIGAGLGFEAESAVEPSKLLSVKTIALLDIPEPPDYGFNKSGAPGYANYGESIFGNTAQATLESILRKNGFEVIHYSPNRENLFRPGPENAHQLIYDYSGLDIPGADAFLDVVPIEVEYKNFGLKVGPHVSASFRLISAASREKIYAGSIQYGWDDSGLRSASVEIDSPKEHFFVSSDFLRANNTKATEWLELGIEAVSSSIAEKIVEGKIVALANNEIETGSYNRSLWEAALLEASCFESEAKSLYVPARVRQLSCGNSSESSSVDPVIQQVTLNQPNGDSVTGTYISAVTTSSNRVFRTKEHRRLEVNFEQVGNCILGTDTSGDVKFTGIREGDNVSFSIQPGQLANDEITGNWSIAEGGELLAGKWTNSVASGEWNLRRVDRVVPGAVNSPAPSWNIDCSESVESVDDSKTLVTSAATTHTAAKPITITDLSGTYLSEYTGKSLQGDPEFRAGNFQVMLVQEGNKISGFFGGGGKVWGDIMDDQTIKFDLYSTAGYARFGTWRIDPVTNSLKGKISATPPEEWILIKIR